MTTFDAETSRARLAIRLRWGMLAAGLGIMVACAGPAASAEQAQGPAQPTPTPAASPPFWGTIFIDPDIITPADPSSFEGLRDAGRGERTMYDRRVDGWITVEAFLFDARYDDGLAIEIQVNPEFASVDAARAEAERFAPVIGQLPRALRVGVETVWIHQGTAPFGGGNHNLLIHVGQAERYVAEGILEETLVHEAAHSSLDETHAAAPGWLAAQAADGGFISTYARDNPDREDIAESYLPYLALRHRADRISGALAATIQATIPNRMRYFDALDLDLYPIRPEVARGVAYLPALFRSGGSR
ncbi:MAG: hypothetical protein H6648_09255 [Caldilineae bacterium]|nr:hypothetical protein [Chloroflexota bacterium]MCB9177335.1 hypothetical protein [Caldilineae bacterium]